MKEKEIRNIIAEFNLNETKFANFEEFNNFLKHLLKKEELSHLFKKYAFHSVDNNGQAQGMMTPNDLIKFFKEEQKQKLSLETIQNLNDSLSESKINDPCISVDIFNSILFSPFNMIFNTDYLHEYQVYILSFLFLL